MRTCISYEMDWKHAALSLARALDELVGTHGCRDCATCDKARRVLAAVSAAEAKSTLIDAEPYLASLLDEPMEFHKEVL